MIQSCGLNRLVQYATFVSVHIRAAQADPDVKHALQSLRQILYTGVALDSQDSQWAFEHHLRLTVSVDFVWKATLTDAVSEAMYGTSETGTQWL